MNTPLSVRAIDHRSAPVAEQLHALQFAAYSQEAQLLGAEHFPPLVRSASDVRRGEEAYLAAFLGSHMVGAIGVEREGQARGMCIASLVVLPEFQRRGIGSRLVAEIVAAHCGNDLHVETGAGNAPALAVYAKAGFVEFRRWHVGPEALELVALVRSASVGANAHNAT